MFKFNNKDTRMTPFSSFWCFIVNFEHISHLHTCSSVSIVNFEHVIASWAIVSLLYAIQLCTTSHSF